MEEEKKEDDSKEVDEEESQRNKRARTRRAKSALPTQRARDEEVRMSATSETAV